MNLHTTWQVQLINSKIILLGLRLKVAPSLNAMGLLMCSSTGALGLHTLKIQRCLVRYHLALKEGAVLYVRVSC